MRSVLRAKGKGSAGAAKRTDTVASPGKKPTSAPFRDTLSFAHEIIRRPVAALRGGVVPAPTATTAAWTATGGMRTDAAATARPAFLRTPQGFRILSNSIRRAAGRIFAHAGDVVVQGDSDTASVTTNNVVPVPRGTARRLKQRQNLQRQALRRLEDRIAEAEKKRDSALSEVAESEMNSPSNDVVRPEATVATVSAEDMFFPAPHMAAAAEAAASTYYRSRSAAAIGGVVDTGIPAGAAASMSLIEGAWAWTGDRPPGVADRAYGKDAGTDPDSFGPLERMLESRLLENGKNGGELNRMKYSSIHSPRSSEPRNNAVTREVKRRPVTCGIEGGGGDVVCRVDDTGDVVMQCVQGSIGDNMEGLVCDVAFSAR